MAGSLWGNRMKTLKPVLSVLLGIGLAVISPNPARADITAKDVQVMARALGFADKAPTGEVKIGIVFAPGNAASAAQADAVQKLMGDGVKAGNLVLKPVPVKIDEASGADVSAFLLIDGLGADGAKLAAVTKAKQKPCLTIDIAQVQNGSCAMGIKSEPKVEILVNKAAAEASGLSFAASFRMMITEL
jgi:hypothetical protein